MPTIIASFIAGNCAPGFITIWFWATYRELPAKRNSLADLMEGMRLHERLFSQVRDGPAAQSAAGMLETTGL